MTRRKPLSRTSSTGANALVVALNVGSSSMKMAVFRARDVQEKIRMVSETHDPGHAKIRIEKQGKLVRTVHARGATSLIDLLHQMIVHATEVIPTLLDDTVAVGHRFVHGGERFVAPTLLTKRVFEELVQLEPLAPLHNPYAIEGMTAAVGFFPNAASYVVFDTGFFHSLEPHVYLYALPYDYYTHFGLRRFGFHGISHEAMLEAASTKLQKPRARLNLVTCHLGAGSSLAAIRAGMPLDTTMGFSPLEGLTMSTRCGDLDPMVVLTLLHDLKLSHQDAIDVLNNASGLLGISGFSADLRDIMATAGYPTPGGMVGRAKGFRKRATLALKMYVYDVQRYLASYLGLLGNVDAIVFSGAAGVENATLRRLILRGVPIAKKVRVLTVQPNEEFHLAKQWQRLAS